MGGWASRPGPAPHWRRPSSMRGHPQAGPRPPRSTLPKPALQRAWRRWRRGLRASPSALSERPRPRGHPLPPSAVPRPGEQRGPGPGGNEPEPRRPGASRPAHPGSSSWVSYLAGFVKLLLQPGHRHRDCAGSGPVPRGWAPSPTPGPAAVTSRTRTRAEGPSSQSPRSPLARPSGMQMRPRTAHPHCCVETRGRLGGAARRPGPQAELLGPSMGRGAPGV